MISDWQADDISVTPCEKFEIVIQGRRLWRRTVVTLWAAKASSIYVLPDMRGIIATFSNIEIPAHWVT